MFNPPPPQQNIHGRTRTHTNIHGRMQHTDPRTTHVDYHWTHARNTNARNTNTNTHTHTHTHTHTRTHKHAHAHTNKHTHRQDHCHIIATTAHTTKNNNHPHPYFSRVRNFFCILLLFSNFQFSVFV